MRLQNRFGYWLLWGGLVLAISATAIATLSAPGTPPGAPSAVLPPRLLREPAPLFPPWEARALLEAPSRDAWQQPTRIVASLGLRAGDTVADVGAGSGYLEPYLSAAVGPLGRVYAEEIQPEFLPSLRERARRFSNVRPVLGRADDPLLPTGGIDLFVLLTVYHEIQQPVAFLQTLRRAARPRARLAVIDFPP